ncbi:transporter substrate-binding domain-containing protein [Weissella cibaria]|uniref:transporter substrate-binding domain-containing protein n=1 Tax=Weissella cibaria TaxID=137591 RepID=UPI0007A58352|nr:transporter substrate-binding domain-containing protein [Weissella cibaria]
MSRKFKRTWRAVLAGAAVALLAGSVVATPVHASDKKNEAYNRIMKSDKMFWGVKGDTKLMGLMNIKTGKLEGFDVDMAKQITKRVNPKAKVELTQITSGTRIPMLLNANIDAIIATMSITPDREKVVDFSKPYFNAGQAILVKKGSGIKDIYDLNKPGARILAVAGSTSAVVVKKFAPKAKVVALSDYATALTALKAGQGDALTTDNGILYGMAAGSKSLEVVGGPFTKEPYGVAMDENNPKLVKAVNKAIDDIKADGTYAKLAKKWFAGVKGMDWKELAK